MPSSNFSDRLKDLTEVVRSGKNLAEFLEKTVAQRLLFIQINVEDELNAYTVFETLNARGTGLSPTDLLKNYFVFSFSRTKRSAGGTKAMEKNYRYSPNGKVPGVSALLT